MGQLHNGFSQIAADKLLCYGSLARLLVYLHNVIYDMVTTYVYYLFFWSVIRQYLTFMGE